MKHQIKVSNCYRRTHTKVHCWIQQNQNTNTHTHTGTHAHTDAHTQPQTLAHTLKTNQTVIQLLDRYIFLLFFRYRIK